MQAYPRPLAVLSDTPGVFRIPYFQRAYVWKEENWEEMITDLLDPDPKRSLFLGTLIIKRVETASGEVDVRHVIDGQQRITTLSILLRAVFDSLSESEQKNAKEGGTFNTCLFYKKKQTESIWHVKIEHSKIDRKDYKRVIENGIPVEEIKKIDWENCKSKILRCYKHFLDRLKGISDVDRINLFESLLDQKNNLFVLIDLDGDENEQAIFDTINSAGIRLSSADIIKNALFQRALDKNDDQVAVEKLYSEGWESVFTSDDEMVAFWNTQRATGRLRRDNLEILLHSFAIIEGFFDPDVDKLPDLAKNYKKRINTLDWNAIKNMIMSIKEYADLYRKKFPVFDKSDLFGYNDEENEKRLFHILDVCDITTFHPYILFLYRKYKDQQPELVDALKQLETFVIRRAICKLETKNYNKLCKEVIGSPSKIGEMLSEATDDSIRGGLCDMDNRHATLILFWVELYRRQLRTCYQDKDNLKYVYSLEHIMPQQWKEHWGDVPIIGEDGNQMDAESIAGEECRKRHIYAIGNMTLLKSSLNSALQNHSFQCKIEGDGSKKKTIKDYAELLITTEDIVNPYNEGNRIWDETRIRERTSKIAKTVLEMWSV